MLNTDDMIKLIPLYSKAAVVTVQLTLLAVLISLIIGISGNLAYYYRISVLNRIVKFYTEISRNTPILAQLFFLYFGLPALGIRLSGFACGTIALSFLGGGYMIEGIRSGFEVIGANQMESALSLGLSRTQILWHVISPQAFRASLPAVSANIIFLLKETSLAGAIAIPDLMHTATSQISMYYRTNESLIMLTLYYVLLIGPLCILFSLLERRLGYGRN